MVSDPGCSLFWGVAGAETQTELRSMQASTAVRGATSYFAQLVMQHSGPRETEVPGNTSLDGGNSEAAARWVGPCALLTATYKPGSR